jgi:uncharacterized membrane protein YdbT with pleckstrin-like domain
MIQNNTLSDRLNSTKEEIEKSIEESIQEENQPKDLAIESRSFLTNIINLVFEWIPIIINSCLFGYTFSIISKYDLNFFGIFAIGYSLHYIFDNIIQYIYFKNSQ